VIRIRDLTYARGGRVLIRNASLSLPPRTRIGIVGANGTGKSTLFAVIRGSHGAEQGDIELPGGWVLAHVAQEIEEVNVSAQEFVLQGDAELISIETKIASLAQETSAHAGVALAEAYAQLDVIGGHSARARAAELLAGLGFTQTELAQPVKAFSGGWRMRLNLAQALMTRSDLLLLDEPTNHLDMDAVLWLESWLLRYQGTLMMITHDRDFLDAVATHIVQLDGNANMALYAGNYSGFETQRSERLSTQQSAYEKQQRTIAHLESYVTRFRAKATKAKQAQSRIKALERMELIAAAHVDSPFTFRFREAAGEPRQLLRLEAASLGYGARTVVDQVEMSILPQSRIGLLGRNGQGKSTLVKALAGDLAPLAGVRHTGLHLKVGYFAQHQLDTLRLDETALWHMQQRDQLEAAHFRRPLARDQELRDFLGSFDFRGERLDDPVRVFSGGEKARLALALIVWQKPNLLLLDEPTNHLDIEMRQALTEALVDFEGAMVIVAHDRHLLRATCDEFWWVHAGQASLFEGDLDDYRDATRISANAEPIGLIDSDKQTRKDERRQEAQERHRLAQLRKPLEKQIAALEKTIAEKSAQREALQAWLASEAAYLAANKDQLTLTLRDEAELAQAVSTAEAQWFELQTQLEWIH
jgi:ATP-binding cassette, subfamily F, member 3